MGGTMDGMDGTKYQRRGNTRQRIQDVALELFAERGYEKTSLREIAERLDVTKAALYYHFKTKEDILISLFQDLTRPVDELIGWAREQPRTLDTKREVLRRYSEALSGAERLFRFMQENQATVRELSVGESFRDRLMKIMDIVKEPAAPLTDQVRCVSALFSIHAGMITLQDVEGDPEEKREAVLEVAIDLVTQAHGGGHRIERRPPCGPAADADVGNDEDPAGQRLMPWARRKPTGSTAEP
jgi:AcrR family transcriptional regulator